ncbi:nucleotide exchange factor GrpE [Sporolactobacillus terrae]|uniref:Protein GrpE n=1 Tax=Sporolactobacillus terrae TaxID=269673 RepID=A0A410D9U5_9BACL|nr:nucleotide exchange factor GrpE [Sporolactobacillus terrae]QAA22844.1 nucleotide exchange factor GrpE [Sporolactobacillus terrae]QAA25818.1 nucleotide exchange factor GrpE [Sporolactobacillus terrae]UAK17694.1 nucleotide exchange factor GrpE [Sporolactobacillus terrae]BBN99242.1 protein GrpE [Sporolactobacillus terrae]
MTEQANKDSQKINEEVEMETDPQTQAAEPGEGAEEDRAPDQNDDQRDREVLVKKIAEQTAEIEALKKKNDELNSRMLRTQADFDNFRKRTNKEKTDSRKFRAQDLVSDMLEILDNFQRALAVETTSEDGQSLKKGMEMVLSKLEDALKKEGVEEIPSLNQPFDPNVHQAVMQEESAEHESGTVIQVLQAGYTLNGRVIRPAMVKVSA